MLRASSSDANSSASQSCGGSVRAKAARGKPAHSRRPHGQGMLTTRLPSAASHRGPPARSSSVRTQVVRHEVHTKCAPLPQKAPSAAKMLRREQQLRATRPHSNVAGPSRRWNAASRLARSSSSDSHAAGRKSSCRCAANRTRVSFGVAVTRTLAPPPSAASSGRKYSCDMARITATSSSRSFAVGRADMSSAASTSTALTCAGPKRAAPRTCGCMSVAKSASSARRGAKPSTSARSACSLGVASLSDAALRTSRALFASVIGSRSSPAASSGASTPMPAPCIRESTWSRGSASSGPSVRATRSAASAGRKWSSRWADSASPRSSALSTTSPSRSGAQGAPSTAALASARPRLRIRAMPASPS
mmetsp:Transcript_14050/g.46151  ORF Transcript_14050/g.46151 Transcript_14050/m.46151 type:complete len:363 (-) Transcript_14050:21-1109(-)